MSLPPPSNRALQEASHREDVVRDTAAQIIKDFSQFGLDISFPPDTLSFFDELFQQMRMHVIMLLDQNREVFFNLLYRIDVSSAEVNLVFDETPPAEWADNLTLVIINRELKKVLTRRYFSRHIKD